MARLTKAIMAVTILVISTALILNGTGVMQNKGVVVERYNRTQHDPYTLNPSRVPTSKFEKCANQGGRWCTGFIQSVDHTTPGARHSGPPGEQILTIGKGVGGVCVSNDTKCSESWSQGDFNKTLWRAGLETRNTAIVPVR